MQLPENMISNKEIGKLKLEHEINKGIFISDKLYCFFDKNNKNIKSNLYKKCNSYNY